VVIVRRITPTTSGACWLLVGHGVVLDNSHRAPTPGRLHLRHVGRFINIDGMYRLHDLQGKRLENG